MEHVAEQDDALLVKYLDGEELTIDEIKAASASPPSPTRWFRLLRHFLSQQGRTETAGRRGRLYAVSAGCTDYQGSDPDTGEE